jgi:uncharacterized protein YjbJ (UPF0337 family)
VLTSQAEPSITWPGIIASLPGLPFFGRPACFLIESVAGTVGQVTTLSRYVSAPKGGFDMNWDRIAGSWMEFKGRAKEQWGKLTDDDLDQIDGKREALAGRLQNRYGMAKDEADRQINDWMRRW